MSSIDFVCTRNDARFETLILESYFLYFILDSHALNEIGQYVKLISDLLVLIHTDTLTH